MPTLQHRHQSALKAPIKIRGAHQNNLQHLDLDITPGSYTVITGPSGSGKSSLAFDTLYAEGQRRYVETFSPYARQFLDRCDRPKVDLIDGVPPAIAIEQNNSVRTSRSTVGTMTELNDYIKLLFARQADLFCGQCGIKVQNLSASDMFQDMCQWAGHFEGARIAIAFCLTVPDTIDIEMAKNALSAQGYTHILQEQHFSNHWHLDIAVDRFRLNKISSSRGVEAFEKALSQAKDHIVKVIVTTSDGLTHTKRYVAELTCPECLRHYSPPTPSRFSFNSAVGACENCRGFGRVIGIDLALIIPNEDLSLAQGAVKPWQGQGASSECQSDMLRYAKRDKIRVNIPFKELSPAEKSWVINGEDTWNGNWSKQWYGIRNYFAYLESKAYKMHVRVMLSRYRSYTLCPCCQGARLKSESLFWRIGSLENATDALQNVHGRYARFVPQGMGEKARYALDQTPGLNVHDIMQLPIHRLLPFFTQLKLNAKDSACLMVIDEILTRLNYLVHVGLGYLTLNRQSRTLSGGEVQRVNLTTALGTNLVDTLFVLDEPSVGLHPRDMDRVNAVMQQLKNAGNTLVVVEHDPQVMMAADRIIDMGPGAGTLGGKITFDGTPSQLRRSDSLTGHYLKKNRPSRVFNSQVSEENFENWIELHGAAANNLRHISVKFPLHALSTVTGVSGSGKSTLIGDVLVPALQKTKGIASSPACFESLSGAEHITDILFVDQSPIGKSSRSNPVVYIGAFTGIRSLFAQTHTAQQRQYDASTFSFNSGTGRCPTCQGAGFERVEMQFLSDVYLKCPDCDGKRYRQETLEVTINPLNRGEKNIADVLALTVDDALTYFDGFKEITSKLHALQEVGLGYLQLGQSVSTLSGGEAQRLKLAEILATTKTKKNSHVLYVFDEPTTGLHFCDIEKLLLAFRKLIQAGHSVLTIEHNLDVISASDWIIDLGPEGGDQGGELIAQCTPEKLTKIKRSYTGQALSAYRVALQQEEFNMSGLACANQPSIVSAPKGRSLQSVWRHARQGDLGIFGAREHNLKNIDVVIPKNQLSVITGVSGSGKSSLAFGIIFSEGQRRYLESLNAYARSIAQPAPKADVEQVIGISPTVAIEQRTSRGGRKSTVATLTEIHHFLRLLFVKLGVQYCPTCHIAVTNQSKHSILSEIFRCYKNQIITIASPIVIARKGIYTELAQWAKETLAIHWLRVDGQWVPTDPFPKLARYKEHHIELPVHTTLVTAENESEISQALDSALFHGHGTILVLTQNQSLHASESLPNGQIRSYSTKRACPQCLSSFPEPDPRLFSYNSKIGWCPTCFGTGRLIAGFDATQSGEESIWNDASVETVCPQCHGTRLNATARHVLFNGLSIGQIAAMSVKECLEHMQSIHLSGRAALIGHDAIEEIIARLKFLNKVGLGYLCLDRDAPSLSGGEAQRIRLAAQLGSNLQGVCYVLDEPTIGLHPRDNTLLIESLTALKDKGNTVVVVEHDEEMIRHADHIIDIGPGAGSRGGHVLALGDIASIENHPNSITGQLLRRPIPHSLLPRRCMPSAAEILIKNVTCHNLRHVDISFPLERLVALTGVSGSGKSTLARDVLLRNVVQLKQAGGTLQHCEAVCGIDLIDKVLEVDQSPIGKNSRSCPATYVGFFNAIRDLFAATPEALARGYTATRFSFNTAQGRCPVCEGQGEITVEMSFLPDVKVPCEHCNGMRFDEETLAVKWHELSIGDILNLSVDEALSVFENTPRIAHPLELLQAVGLGYLKLGQPSSTLSGGESQRIKLVTELAKAYTASGKINQRNAKTLYILDEPTVGLHMADVAKLISVLHRLVDAGHSVLVVEHNLDVIAEADWIIDLGPEGGPLGGKITGMGIPSEIARQNSPTGKALREFLSTHATPSNITTQS